MARDKAAEAAIILRNRVESWARIYGLEDDVYVKKILAALTEKKNWPLWASLNPLEYLPSANSDSEVRFKTLLFIMTIVRNGLVFVPVAVTWLAISKATAAFAIFSSKNPNGVANFLDFWEKGYGILAPEWEIGNVAFVDFLIILLIISMTITTTVLGRVIENQKEIRAKSLDDERTGIALAISEFFFDKQQVTNVTMNQGLARAIRDLNNSTQSIAGTTSLLNKAVKALPSQKELMTEIKNIKLKMVNRTKNED
jgi:hypothetical protein